MGYMLCTDTLHALCTYYDEGHYLTDHVFTDNLSWKRQSVFINLSIVNTSQYWIIGQTGSELIIGTAAKNTCQSVSDSPIYFLPLTFSSE